jgi:ATP-dependent 26S proteasome regulatory subunit
MDDQKSRISAIDPRVLRGGRFTKKIEVGIPDDPAICD